MNHLSAFKANKALIDKYGIGNAHLVWVMGLYLDISNLEELASEALTDNFDDKKIDFIKLDPDSKKLVFAQGYYSERKVDSAPSNKASDLNTAAAWLLSGDLGKVPSPLREIIKECRSALEANEIDQIDLLYVHNLPESVAVTRELKTAADHLSTSLPKDKKIAISYKEIGIKETEDLFTEQSSQIVMTDEVEIPAEFKYEETGPDWSSAVLTIPASWLRDQFIRHGDKLFSANYRGFLGISKRKKINYGIKNTAEKQPSNFWVYNNGITILTHDYGRAKNATKLAGLSIINGAQTTGSLGSLGSDVDLSKVNVLARIIKCSNPLTIEEIIKYNNTQNRITTWDRFSNDSIQKTIQEEFRKFGHEYSLKRGFSNSLAEIGIENVAQPLIAIIGNYQEANRGKNGVFESDTSYRAAFENTKARHILFAFCLNRAIDEKRYELKLKKENNTIIEIEDRQLSLLRELKFKNFFIAVFGRCIESLLGQRSSIKEVGFTPENAQASSKTVNQLIVEILPVVNMVLTFTATSINGREFSDILKEENSVERISSQVSAIIYATISASMNPALEVFRKMVSPR